MFIQYLLAIPEIMCEEVIFPVYFMLSNTITYKCKHCHQKFPQMEECEEHADEHKRLMCFECGTKFWMLSKLKAHRIDRETYWL